MLVDRSRESKERFQTACELVRLKAGTLNDMCLSIAVAFIDPSAIDTLKNILVLRNDSKVFQQVGGELLGKFDTNVPLTATDLYERVMAPEFVGGFGIVPGNTVRPGTEEKKLHVALLMPGLGEISVSIAYVLDRTMTVLPISTLLLPL